MAEPARKQKTSANQANVEAESKKAAPKKLTVADLATYPDDVFVELIDGVPFVMEAPSTLHQHISGELLWLLKGFLRDKPCQVFSGPLGVYLPKRHQNMDDAETLVIPDLVVVCDPKKLLAKGCRGAPDLAIEILSPSSRAHDQVRKLNLYEKHGVKEFWVIDPDGAALVFTLQENGRYGRPATFDLTMNIQSVLFPDLKIPFKSLMPKVPYPEGAQERVPPSKKGVPAGSKSVREREAKFSARPKKRPAKKTPSKTAK